MSRSPTQNLDLPDSRRCQSLRRALIHWYRKHARPLPWRRTTDPYRIWISEIMLQQTTVKAVIPYYERFLKRFPTVRHLARASEADVLKHWEGLGYYSRGRNLHLAARQVIDQYDGVFPRELDSLQKLPGIGRYTAGAIRSFAFDLPAPIVEANTLRLYCRLTGYAGNPTSREGQQFLWDVAKRLQPQRRSGHLNQALMELGAVICTPAAPRCDVCPIARHCVAFAQGRQLTIPQKKSRAEVTQVVEATVAVRCHDRYLVWRRGPEERWAGMWDFVRFPIQSIQPHDALTKQHLARLCVETSAQLVERLHSPLSELTFIHELRHSVTRYRIRLLCLTAELDGESPAFSHAKTRRRAGDVSPPMLSHHPSGKGSIRWVTLADLKSLPMPVTGREFARILAAK